MEGRTELIHRALLAMAERLIKALPYPDIQVNKKKIIFVSNIPLHSL